MIICIDRHDVYPEGELVGGNFLSRNSPLMPLGHFTPDFNLHFNFNTSGNFINHNTPKLEPQALKH
jgi:hypothetical protein